ncbi:MAG: DUF2628 domain-containing protein [Pseudomonadota bacterium]
MELKLWTVHHKGAQDVHFVADGFSFFALVLPPFWAAWNGLWVVLFWMLALLAIAATVNPLATSPAIYAIGLIAAFEGGALARLEYRARGWRAAGLVEAATIEGAEEEYVSGRSVAA